MKICIHCKQPLHHVAFGKDASTADGLRRWCKNCTNERGRVVYHANPENRARVFRRYKITEQQYQTIRKAQGGGCFICDAKPERLVIDHDHETGVVRGLLCRPCNFMLGNSKENTETLRKAAAYLEVRSTAPLWMDYKQAAKYID